MGLREAPKAAARECELNMQQHLSELIARMPEEPATIGLMELPHVMSPSFVAGASG